MVAAITAVQIFDSNQLSRWMGDNGVDKFYNAQNVHVRVATHMHRLQMDGTAALAGVSGDVPAAWPSSTKLQLLTEAA